MNEIPRADPQILAELAREAKDILDNRAFTAVMSILKSQWYGEMITDGPIDPERVRDLRAKLIVLESFPQLLRGMMTKQQRGADARRA